MKRSGTVIISLLFLLVASTAAAQSVSVTCTDATRTNCTAKKNQPFQMTADPALTTDAVPTEKWRLYINGNRVAEQFNAGAAPLFDFASGLSTTGSHTIYLEAIGTAFDVNGQPVEVASGPSNVVTLTIVTGSLSAPKNLRIVAQ